MRTTWRVLEARFRELTPALAHARLDIQWGSSGDHWRLAGFLIDPSTRDRFSVLSCLAGRGLQALGRAGLPDEVQPVADDDLRWVTALRTLSPAFRSDQPTKELDAQGRALGWIHGGSVPQNPGVLGASGYCDDLTQSWTVSPGTRSK